MSPLSVLNNYYVGKIIVGGDLPSKYNGCEIVDVKQQTYEPLFLFAVKFRDGKIELVEVLEDWDVLVQPIR